MFEGRLSIFEGRHINHRSSKVDTSIIGLRRSTHPSPKVDTSIFESRHIDLRWSTHRDINLQRAIATHDLRRATYRSLKVDTSIINAWGGSYEWCWTQWGCLNQTVKDLERSCGQYSVTNCKCDVSAFDLRKSMCRLSKIDDRLVDLRRSVIDVSTFEDRWSMCRPSNIDGRCEIRLLYLLKTLIL